MNASVNWTPSVAFCDNCKTGTETTTELVYATLSPAAANFPSQAGWHCAACQGAAAAADAQADCYGA